MRRSPRDLIRPLLIRLVVGLIIYLILTTEGNAGSYRVEILTSDRIGITEPQRWAAALGRAGCGAVRIRSTTGNERIEIRNSGTSSDPEIVVVGQILPDGRLRLPGGVHPLSEAGVIVESLEKLAHPTQESEQNTKTEEISQNTKVASSETATSRTTRDLLFAQPVGFSTTGMEMSEVLRRITDHWRREGLTIHGLDPVLRTMRDQERTEMAKRERYRKAMDDIRQRQLSGEVLDPREELAKIYGEAPGSGKSGAQDGVTPDLPRFESLRIAPELERCASGSAVAYLLRCGGFAMESEETEMAVIPLRIPVQEGSSPHPVGRDPDSAIRAKKLCPQLDQTLSVTRLDQVRPDRFLANLSGRLELPILVDYAALRAKRTVLDQRPLSLPATESTYRRVIADALKPLGLRAVVRTDDAGNPFLWVTTGYVRIP
ncbi:MAG: hypothetical protein Q4C47_02225 [Planctomycetia bacterium]|nr:hypothetical protein [Planctomycetia bacterium]